jgi:hypothetical protein
MDNKIKIEFDGRPMPIRMPRQPWYERAYWAVWHNITDLFILAACAAAVWSFV